MIRKYLNLLDETGSGDMALPALVVFREIDWLKNNMGMISGEMSCVRDRAAALPESAGKRYIGDAIAAAQEGIALSQEHFLRVEELIENGAKESVRRFRNGNDHALEKPFPILAVENELKSMMERLEAAYIPVDIGIGRTEEAEGMVCDRGHYLDAVHGCLWEGGAGNQALPGVLWPMRTLEQVIGQAYDAAHVAASRVDCMRPKAHSIVKKVPLVPGYFWKREKQERQPGQGQPIKQPTGEKPMDAGTRKPSLRKRLQVAEAASHMAYPALPVCGKEKKVCEAQR